MSLGLPSAIVPASQPVDPVPRRAVLGLAAAASLVSLGSGVALAFVYRPHEAGVLRALHAGTAAVAVMSVIAAHVIGSGGRLKPTRRGAVLVVGLVLALGAAIATGTALAWTDASPAEPFPADRGVFLPAGARVVVSGRAVSGRSIVITFIVHAVLGVCSLAVLGGEYVRSRWAQRRTGQ
jgi:hypothetical protein